MQLRIFIISLFTFLSFVSQAQIVEDGCIRIDFESILGETPTSGMSLGTQYFSSTGVSFYLESGAVPVIAGIGPPIEAYQGPFTSDSGPDDDILGDFMLTDDGLLSADLVPLFISFANPVDSLSAVILDLDGDEFFDITAFDALGNPVFEQTINAGDPGTGDGIATPFGFNLPSCEGTVSTISFSGMRNDGGGFGLAMDNFILCFEGVDLLEDLEVMVSNIVCQDNPGEIQVINNGDLDLMFSIDGNNFNDTGFFPDLIAGEYIILVQDENGCEAFLTETVLNEGPTIIEDVIVTHTSCGLDNGSFTVIATQEEGVIYFIDAFEISNDNVFSDLPAGTYPITVIGPTGCSASSEVVINPSVSLDFEGLTGEDDNCQQMTGSIAINATGGTGEISYSLDDGMTFQEGILIDSLTQGQYNLIIQDEAFCTVSDSIALSETPGLSISPLQVTETECEIPSGVIQFTAEGGTGDLQYQVNGGPFQDLSYFDNLVAGQYSIAVTDEVGCLLQAVADIEIPICPIYIPNVFTPPTQDVNGEFRLFTVAGQEVNILKYLIFDRWGNRIYSAYNFDIFSDGNWWQGKEDGNKWSSGVYVYLIEVEYYNGTRDTFAGDITLLR